MKKAVLLVLAALGAVACGHAPVRTEVVWPPPPEKPRIRFVQAFRTLEDVDPSKWARFKRSVLGNKGGDPLSQPMGLALSEDGERLYIADFRGSQILVLDFKEKALSRFAPDFFFPRPFNVALDAAENVYVSDSQARNVSVYSRDGEQLRVFGSGELERPTGLAIDKQRRLLYVTDSSRASAANHRVLVYSLEGEKLREIGKGKGGGDGEFYFPLYVALDAGGNVFVADTMNFRIQVFDAEGRFVRKYGEQGNGPGAFARIKGMAFDGFGNLYVADGEHSVVQIFNRDFQPLMYFGGFVAKLEYFDIPSCVVTDPKKNLIFVCNEHNPRINVYELINTGAQDSRAAGAAGPR